MSDTTVTEIAPDLFRISTYIAPADLQFSQFLVRDEAPMLFHTGLRRLFPKVRDAVASVLDPASLRWIAFSHYEADECGSLNEWLEVAPNAQPACSLLGALVSVNDVADRPARGLEDGEVVTTGRYRWRFLRTPHVPHGWEAGLLFEETQSVLLSSDLLHQIGDLEPVTDSPVIGRARAALQAYRGGVLDNYLPYTPLTEPTLERLASLQPKIVAPMHGSAYVGDGSAALRELAGVLREYFGGA